MARLVSYAAHPPARFRDPTPHPLDATLSRLLTDERPAVVRLVTAALRQTQAAIDPAALTRAVATRDAGRVLVALPVSALHGALAGPLHDALLRVAADVLAEPASPGRRFASPDIARAILGSARATRYVTQQVAASVTDLVGTSQAAVRAMVTSTLATGGTPASLADQLRAVVGLTPPQAVAYANVRRGVLARGGTEVQATNAATTYRNQALAQRAEHIARTEIARTVNLVRLARWQDQVDAGQLDPRLTQKVWQVDGHPCAACSAMAGEQADFDQPFSNGLMTPPAHSNCCCVVVMAEG